MTDSEQNDRVRVYSAHMRLPADDSMMHDARVTNIQNAFRWSLSRAIVKIHLAGLDALEAEIDDDAEGVNHVAIAVAAESRRLETLRAEYNRLDIIYEERGPIDFQGWATETGVDYQAFLADRRDRISEAQWPTRVRSFLFEYLADGEPHATNEIRTAAELCGLLSGTDGDWQKMRLIASRDGMTQRAKHGFWQR